MAGLEVVVRPVVFPNIRPRARQSLPPQDDPEKGLAVIQGNPAGSVGQSYSWSASASYSRPTEKERRVDDVRVYQQDEDGTVNRDNFIDLQVANRITMDEGAGGSPGASPEGTASEQKVSYYRQVQEADNIEVMRHNHILRSGEEVEAGPI